MKKTGRLILRFFLSNPILFCPNHLISINHKYIIVDYEIKKDRQLLNCWSAILNNKF